MFDSELGAKERLFVDEYSKMLREKRRKEEDRKKLEEQLFQASGIENKDVIRQLIDIGIDPDTLAALSLVPLVEVAWADHRMDDSEKKAILAAAEKHGVEVGSPGHELLESWIEERPDGDLLAAWKNYAAALAHTLNNEIRLALKTSIMGHARAIAEETGGILGLGNKISAVEQKKLDELEEVFA